VVGLIGAAAAVLVVDQLTKLAVLQRQQARPAPRRSGLQVRLALNSTPWPWTRGPVALAILSTSLVVMVVASLAAPWRSPAFDLAAGAIIGGAAGNTIDRLRRGVVIDFIDVGWWPVFNLADVAIVCGGVAVGLILFGVL
jgi:signal peptidase II